MDAEYAKQKEIKLQKGLVEVYRMRYLTSYGRIYQNFWNQTLLDGLPDQRDLTVLDLGCGPGVLLKELARRYNNVYGLDISADLVNLIKQDSANLKEIKIGDAEDISFSDNKFDLICSRGVLHHCPEPEKVLNSVSAKLKTGGWFVLSEPCSDSIIVSLLRKIIIKRSAKFGEVHRAFASKYLKHILERFGFEVKTMQWFGFLAFPICGLSDCSKIINYLPAKKTIARLLIGLDRLLASLPLIRTQAWHIIIKAQKKK